MSWYASAHYVDSLVKDYLVFRKMTATLKSFDAELKSDKDKGFRVDKIVQQLLQYIHTYDIDSLTSYWTYLKETFLIRFAKYHLAAIEKFEADLCRLYMVHAVQNNKTKELQACLQKLTELNNVPGLKDWYVLIFSMPPDLKSMFQPYFSKQWGETFMVSLHNILSAVFSCMPIPDLFRICINDGRIIATLEKENELLKEALNSSVKPQPPLSATTKPSYVENMGRPGSCPQTKQTSSSKESSKISEIFNLFQQSVKDTVSKSDSSHSESIKLPSQKSTLFSAKMEQEKKSSNDKLASFDTDIPKTIKDDAKGQAADGQFQTSTASNVIPQPSCSTPAGQPTNGSKSTGSIEISYDDSINLHSKDLSPVSKTHSSKSTGLQTLPTGPFLPRDESFPGLSEEPKTDVKEPYLILSKDIFHEHHSMVLQCKFDNTGKTIASVDNGGIVKVWQNDPVIKSMATVILHSKIQCLEWSSKSTDFLILGTTSGTIRFFDITSNVTVKEAIVDDAYCSIRNMRVCPSGTYLVTSSMKPGDSKQGKPYGRIMQWDVRSSDITFSRKLQSSNNFFATCMDYNHNGNLMAIGDASGIITLFDMKTLSSIHSCQAHNEAVSSVQFTSDEALVISIGADNEMMAWDVNYLKTNAVKMKFPSLSDNLPLPREPSNVPLMALSPDGNHALVSGGCRGLIYDLDGPNKTASKVLALPEHKSHLTALDWISNKSSGRCLTGSADGKIHVTTLLSQS